MWSTNPSTKWKPPQSCDTFVVLPPSTENGAVVFGKNSDRPCGEVQEIVHVPAQDHGAGEKLQCTYIEIDQVPHCHEVILSKPSWMWGAEMGANEHGVCVGNEAIWTKLNGPQDQEERLLGMDLLRLGLERGASAKEALDVITSLLEEHGQGGPCSDTDTEFTYHNSFLIADRSEAWVLETADRKWAAEQVTSGVRNISNCLTITTKIDAMSSDLLDYAKSKGYWNPADGDFNFSNAYGEPGDGYRLKCGKSLLTKLSASGNFSVTDMFTILRDSESDISRGLDNDFPTTSSQVSVLPPPGSTRPCCHWFTGTPDPQRSVFKPFIFCPNVRISPHIQSPVFSDADDPVKIKPRFQTTVDRRHNLYKLHEVVYKLIDKRDPKSINLLKTLQELEVKCVQDMEKFLEGFTDSSYAEVEDLFKDVVESEMKFYK